MGSKDVADALGSLIYNMHVDPCYGNEDLLMSFVETDDAEAYRNQNNLFNTGDEAKDRLLQYLYTH